MTDNGTPALERLRGDHRHRERGERGAGGDESGNKTVNELATLAFTVTATDADVPANTLTWSLDAGAPAGAAINATTRRLLLDADGGAGPGRRIPITIRATDNGTPALSGRAAITVTVNEVNVAPVLGAIGNKTVNELATLAFTATATDADVPANTLDLLAGRRRSGRRDDQRLDGRLHLDADGEQGQAFPITVRVTDNGTPALNDFEAITVTVNEVNVAPVLGAIGNKTVDRAGGADLHGDGDRSRRRRTR